MPSKQDVAGSYPVARSNSSDKSGSPAGHPALVPIRARGAAHGTAPIPVWSGCTVRHRLNRVGDRQLNVALHRIAITQLQREGPGRTYVAKRMAAGDTKTEAIRALRRRLSDELFRRLSADGAFVSYLDPYGSCLMCLMRLFLVLGERD